MLFLICLSGKAFANDADSWHNVYQLGKFNDPKKADQIFISSYKITNGTVTELEPGAGAFYAHIHSDTNATLYYKIPRNFPYTNSIGSVKTTPPIVMMDVPPIGSPQKDFANSKMIRLTNRTDDCFFTFPVSFSGDHTIQFSFEYLASGGLPSYGDNVPQYCNNQTIAQHLSPLKQIAMGLDPKYVKCDSGLYAVLHPDKSTISCVKPESGEKLIQRGWAKAISWYSDENAAKTNPLGVLALIIYHPPDVCLGPCPPNTFYLKINSVSSAYLLGYNICDANSCAKRNDLSILLPTKDILHPNFQMIGLPEDLKWKHGDAVRIQLYLSSTNDNKTASSLDLGNSIIVS